MPDRVQISNRPSRHRFDMLLYLCFLLLYIPGSSAFPKNDGGLEKRSFYGDSRRNITCLGSSYDLQLPVREDGVDPNNFTMQQLCAKTIYGGAPPGQHLGGWCSRGLEVRDGQPENYSDSDSDSSHDPGLSDWSWTGVSFDLSAASQASEEGADARFLLGCFNRCFCSWEVDDLTIQPKRSVPSNADVSMKDSSGTGEIMLDVTDDVTTTDHSHTGRLGDTMVDSVRLDELIEPNQVGGYAYMPDFHDPPWDLSLDVGNYVTCEGDLPSFPLPQPYQVSDFRNPQELCAVQWSGGLS